MNGILFIYVVLVCGVFHSLMMRPECRRRRARQEMLAAVRKGDEIVTVDGLYGTVRQVRDTFVVLEIAGRTQVRLLKSAISQVQGERQGLRTEDRPKGHGRGPRGYRPRREIQVSAFT